MTAAFSEIQRCRGCHAERARCREVYSAEPMPLAGLFCASEAEARAAPLYPLTLLRCERCGLVQVLEDVDDRQLFGRYSYASETVPGLVRHFEAYAANLAERYAGAEPAVLEIGCNDGVLLRRLPASWRRVGVDPSDVAAAAPEGGYELHNEPFSSAFATRFAGAFDVVTASNCLAHVSDIRDVLEGARAALRAGGELFVEVHDLDAAIAGGQWDVIYHEHKVEWSERSLVGCVGAIGFAVEAVDRLPLHGGLLRARFRKAAAGMPFAPVADDPGLARLAAAYRERRSSPAYLRLADAARYGRLLAAYGASGRANVWFNQLPELRFSYVVDDSPLRAGRWIPRAAFPTVGSELLEQRPPAVCAVTAWNYFDDIVRQHPGHRGMWLATFGGATA